jgi:predicted Ser/Thr protein kinase
MIGTQVGKYRIESELGRGGMGVVYRGLQVTLERTVAIKMLPAHLADADTRARFRREALTLARVAHPNIVSIYDVEEQDGHSFIVMEHVGGGSLGDVIAGGSSLTPARAVEIMSPILSALQAAHLAGVVHRDIKPDNILFTVTGRPKLTDFGVAHMRDGGSRTRTGVMLGTPYYMSPEQAQGRRVTAAADLYAVGVVLFEMLSGRVPFTGQDPVSVALKHVQEPPPSLAAIRPDLPAELCALVHRALEKDPAARFTSAAGMQDALEAGGWSPIRTLDPASSGSRAVASPPAGASQPPIREETQPLARLGPDGGERSPEETRAGAVGVPAVAHAGSSGASSAGAVAAAPDGLSSSKARATGAAEAGQGRGVAGIAQASLAGLETSSRTVGTWLKTPAWRGLPKAFWVGVAALSLAILWIGVDALGRPSSVGDPGSGPSATVSGGRDGQGSPETPGVGASRDGAGPTSRSTQTRVQPTQTGPVAPALTPAEVAELARIASGRDAIDSTGTESGGPGPTGASVLDALGPGEEILTLDDLRDGPVEPEADSEAEAESAQVIAERAIAAIVDRQIRAVETGNRSLFLQDFLPEMRGEAGDEFDAAYVGVTDFRSTTSNLNIEFFDPDHALVTFDVSFSAVVRADGRTIRDSDEESWDLVRIGDRWWISAWN